MIDIKNVSKSYNNYSVLKNISHTFPDSGLVIIKGPSGCGKTTLLNILSGLLDFQGEINILSHHLQQMDEKEKDEFRLKNMGFIFQDFKLFENESVINNIIFPLEIHSSSTKENKYRKCDELIKLVGLKTNRNQKVKDLSGGEKQRVAIARALVNRPKIVFADEPTGSLDEKNAKEVMELLLMISHKSLVIMVTHDDDLANNYADELIEMKDGKIVNVVKYEREKDNKYFPLSKATFNNKRPSLPSSFLLHHSLTSIKSKKWRTSICNLVTSLGLIGVGLATSLSSSISSNIKNAYSQVIDSSKLAITLKKDDKSIYGKYPANSFEVMDIANKYDEDIYDTGLTYQNDFESFFPQSNCIALADITYYHKIDGISARHINEFQWLDVVKPDKIYPEQIDYLENDQVVLALTIDMIEDICYQLHIERRVLALSQYLQRNKLHIFFDLRNDYWQYSDQQILEVVGFTLEKQPGMYHINHRWNEYMFEERMKFPSIEEIEGETKYPWVLKKIYYLHINTGIDSFLKKTYINEDLNNYIFEIANQTYFPLISKQNKAYLTQKLLIFTNYVSNIPMSDFSFFKNLNDGLSNPIYGSSLGYAIYPSSMMFGFSKMMYFSSNEDSIDEVIDIRTSLNEKTNEKMELPSDVKCGHYSQTINGGINYSTLTTGLLKGIVPNSYDDIVISSQLENELFNGDGLNKDLSLCYLASENVSFDGTINRHFIKTSLRVVGVVDSNKNLLFHDEYWPVLFFQTRLGVSAFDLNINSMICDISDEKDIPTTVSKIERAFPNYEVINPMKDISDSVDKVCFYIEIALTCFSIIAVIISTLLLSICNYLYILENRKDIGLARCIGVNKKEARKFVITHSMLLCLVSFVLSSIELLLISFIISKEMSKQMGNTSSFSFNSLSLVWMFLLAFFVSITSSLVIANKVNKLNPIEALKR